MKAQKPFLKIPLAENTPFEISQGWIYSEDERAIHPKVVNHYGIDSKLKYGTPIYAPTSGLAIASYHISFISDPEGNPLSFGLGLCVEMRFQRQHRYAIFAHLSEISKEIPYINPTPNDDGIGWQPKNAINVTLEKFRINAIPIRSGDFLGRCGISGLLLRNEVPSNPPAIDPNVDKTWDPNGAHLHFEVFIRTRGKKRERFDPFGVNGERDQYSLTDKKSGELFKRDPRGNLIFVR